MLKSKRMTLICLFVLFYSTAGFADAASNTLKLFACYCPQSPQVCQDIREATLTLQVDTGCNVSNCGTETCQFPKITKATQINFTQLPSQFNNCLGVAQTCGFYMSDIPITVNDHAYLIQWIGAIATPPQTQETCDENSYQLIATIHQAGDPNTVCRVLFAD